jgi:hypothetical protein
LVLGVNPNTVTASDLLTISCSIKGDSSGSATDTLKYVAAVNLLGQDVVALNNTDFAFRLGNIIYTGTLDSKASYKEKLSDGSQIKVSVSTKTGLLSVQISHGSFGAALDAANLIDGTTTRRPVQISIGDALLSSEVLDFDTRVTSSKYTLNYALGKAGANAGGAFQVKSVKGRDGKTSGGFAGDSWKIGFLCAAAASINTTNSPGLDNVTAVTVRIGTSFKQALSGLKSKGSSTKYSGRVADGITKFNLDAKKGMGSLQTTNLSTSLTGIPQAANAAAFGNVFFQLGLDITRTGAPFTGEHARRVFGLKNQYKDAAPK